jgi:hypothetical protein
MNRLRERKAGGLSRSKTAWSAPGGGVLEKWSNGASEWWSNDIARAALPTTPVPAHLS